MYTYTEGNLTMGITLLESEIGDNLFSFYIIILFIILVILSSLVSYERYFTFEVYRKVAFISIVLNST